VKFSTAADDEPTFVTVALLPGDPVVTVPTATVAAAPAAPFDPLGPNPPLTETSTCAAVPPAAASICVSPTLAVIGLAPLTLALICDITAPRRTR
jgi:hypothetical protein